MTALLLTASASASAQVTWTVDDAVEAALALENFDAIEDATVTAISATADRATLRPLPTLGADVELVTGPDAVRATEATIGLGYEFDVADWRSDVRAGARRRQDAARTGIERMRQERALEVRHAFYSVRLAESRVDAIDGWLERLDEGIAATQARLERGDVARYELVRMQAERDRVFALRAASADEVAASWAAFERLVPLRNRPALVGPLTPEPAADTAIEHERADLRLLAELSEALTLEAAAFGSSWARGWSVGAGYRLVDVPGATGHGVALSLSLPLAVRDTMRPHADELLAESLRVVAELDALRASHRRAIDAAGRRRAAALDALNALEGASATEELLGLVEAAYAAGEAPLAEVLSAWESETEHTLARLDLQWAARQADIEWNDLHGMEADE